MIISITKIMRIEKIYYDKTIFLAEMINLAFVIAIAFALLKILSPTNSQASRPESLTCLLTPLGLWFTATQLNASRFVQQVQLLGRLSDKFDSTEFTNIRSNVAKKLIKDSASKDDEISKIFDFFEEIAFLTKKGGLTKESVNSFFGYWIFNYLHYASTFKENLQKEDPNLYEDLDWLKVEIKKIKDNRKLDNNFLINEKKLSKKRRIG